MKNITARAEGLLRAACAAKHGAAATVSAHRNLALSLLADAITGGARKLLDANEADLDAARAAGADEADLDAMRLDYLRIGVLAGRLRTMAAADDPTDATDEWRAQSGLSVRRMRVPLGVIIAVGGANPRRTIECAAQAVKTGNVLIFVRCPATARTDAAFEALLADALGCCALSPDTVRGTDYDPELLACLLGCADRADAVLLLAGPSQNEMIRKNTSLPIICADTGATHLYIDEGADVAAAATGVVESFFAPLCPLRTVLVNWMVSDEFLPVLEGKAMAAGIELCADARVRSTLHGVEEATAADCTDPHGRLLLLTVNSQEAALDHIARYGAGLCEGIYTSSAERAQSFCTLVDAGTVLLNTSFSHADGFDAGLGADVGIASGKLSGRGPLGLARLTTEKYILKG